MLNINEIINNNGMDKTEKINAIANCIKGLEEKIKREKQEVEKIKNFLTGFMKDSNVKKIETIENTVSLSKKADTLVISDIDKLIVYLEENGLQELISTNENKVVDKKEIKNLILKGMNIPNDIAKVETGGETIKIK
ncbi:MAG: siphovirus Gp157 family protein [Clostridium sp.]|uniref:siphovirus Gp157 family protein n=1 Tax=Clostridium sp. TaxID=1506 RepID=UPI003EE56DDB